MPNPLDLLGEVSPDEVRAAAAASRALAPPGDPGPIGEDIEEDD